MAYVRRVLFLAKRFNNKQTYFSYACKSGTMTEQIMTFSTATSPTFNLCTCSTIEKIRQFSIIQPIRQFCTAEQPNPVENRDHKNLTNVPNRNFMEVDLTSSDLIGTFETLFTIYKVTAQNSKVILSNEINQFVSSKEFVNFCNSLEQKLPLLTAGELKLLLHLNIFKIPASSVLMQKIYHLIIEKINEYSPLEMISIYETLNCPAHKESAKGNVLRIICLEYFRFKLGKDLNDCKDYNGIARFCKSDKIPFFVKKKLLKLIRTKFSTIHSQLNLSSLCRLFAAFWDEGVHSYFTPEMYHVLKERIAEKPSFVQTRNILIGLKHLGFNVIDYDEDFYNVLVENAVEKNQSVRATLELSKYFLQQEHLCLPLVRHLEKAFLDPRYGLLSERVILEIAKVLSDTYCHPFGYEGDDQNHVECMQKLESFNFPRMDLGAFVEWCLRLTILGSGKKIECLNQLFTHLSESYENNTLVPLKPTVLENIIILNAFSRKYFPVDVYRLPEKFLSKCHMRLQTEDRRAVHDIVCNFFDKEVQAFEYCTSSLQHFIDYAVVVGEKTTAALNSQNKNGDSTIKIDDIERSPSSRLILFHLYTGSFPCQFKNSSTLPGRIQLLQLSYEKFNSSVVIIHDRYLKLLNNKEQVSFLAKKIKENIYGN